MIIHVVCRKKDAKSMSCCEKRRKTLARRWQRDIEVQLRNGELRKPEESLPQATECVPVQGSFLNSRRKRVRQQRITIGAKKKS